MPPLMPQKSSHCSMTILSQEIWWLMDGERGEELQAISRLGKVAYESKRTKIRRRVEKFFDAEP